MRSARKLPGRARNPLLRVIIAEDEKSRGGEGNDLTIRMLYLPALLLAAVLLACAAALLALSEKAEATFPGKNGRIVYSGFDGHDNEIYTINPDGTGRFNVTKTNAWESNPDYSPNGKKIAYESEDGLDPKIYTIKVGGGGKSQVTNSKYEASQPSWGSRP